MEKIYHSYHKLSKCSKFKGFCEQEDGSLLLNEQEGSLISDTIYAEEIDTVWQFLNINVNPIWNIEVYIWISNDKMQLENLNSYDYDTQLNWLKVNHVIKLKHNHCYLFDDDNIKGNFMKFAMIMYLPHDTHSILYGYDVYFPLASFVRYLPACFDNNEKRMKFLNEYQTMYELLEEEIEINQYEMDVEACKSNQLNILAKWLDASEIDYLYDDKKKRKLLANYIPLNRMKGTIQYYRLLVKYVCDSELYLILDHENNKLHIYGYMKNADECQKREQLFKDRVPLYITCCFHWNVIAKMNEHIYMGINSVLSEKKDYYEIHNLYI